jgi:Spy/CpxP family protein refolding chaperone
MKNIVKIITFGAICAGLSLAQQRGPSIDPAAMVQRQITRLDQTLSLTAEQKTQATTLFTNAMTSNQAVMENLRHAHTSLAAAIKSNDANAISTLSAQIGTLTGQMTANTAKADASFYGLLTPDQQSKYTPTIGFGGMGGGGNFGARGGAGARRGGSRQ